MSEEVILAAFKAHEALSGKGAPLDLPCLVRRVHKPLSKSQILVTLATLEARGRVARAYEFRGGHGYGYSADIGWKLT